MKRLKGGLWALKVTKDPLGIRVYYKIDDDNGTISEFIETNIKQKNRGRKYLFKLYKKNIAVTLDRIVFEK